MSVREDHRNKCSHCEGSGYISKSVRNRDGIEVDGSELCVCRKSKSDRLVTEAQPKTDAKASAVGLAPPPPSRKWMHAPPLSDLGQDFKSKQAGDR